MEQLSLMAPALVGLAVALASVLYAHRITANTGKRGAPRR